MKTIFAIITISLFVSCNNSDKEKELLQKENELLKREIELNKKDSHENSPEIIDNHDKNKKGANSYNPNDDVTANIIHCESEKFTIRIDRLTSGEMRYTSWSKPKTEKVVPDITLYNPEVEKQGTGGGWIYTFKNGEWKYIVEDNQMGETDETIGRFLKLQQNQYVIHYTKMRDLE